MSTRAEFFQSMYPGLSDGEVIDELIKASIYGFEHGPEVVTISAAEGIHYVPYDAAMQKKSPYWEGTYKACNIPFTDFQIRYGQPAEKILRYYFQARFVRPKVRPYKNRNYYALLMKGDDAHDSVSEKE